MLSSDYISLGTVVVAFSEADRALIRAKSVCPSITCVIMKNYSVCEILQPESLLSQLSEFL